MSKIPTEYVFKDEKLVLRVAKRLNLALREASEREHMPVSKWVRRALTAALSDTLR